MGLSALANTGLEEFGRFYSFYICTVVDNQDPDGKGALKLFSHQVQGGYTFWALPKTYYGGNGYGFKKPIPQIGDLVLALFEQGDLCSPVWEYCTWLISDAVPQELKPLNTFGMVTPKGNKVYINDDTGDVTVNVIGNINVDSAKQIIFNRGENMGMVKIQELTDKINNLVQELETLRSSFNSHVHPGVSSGPGSTGPTISQVSKPFTQFKKDDYENTQILQ